MIPGKLISYSADGGYVPEFCRSWYAEHDDLGNVTLHLKPVWRVIPWDFLAALESRRAAPDSPAAPKPYEPWAGWLTRFTGKYRRVEFFKPRAIGSTEAMRRYKNPSDPFVTSVTPPAP